MSMKELYGIIVYNCSIAPDYFFDKMSELEMQAVIDAYFEDFKDNWEKTRTLVHSTFSVYSGKPLKHTDVLEFAWDSKTKKKLKSASEIQADIHRIRERFNK